MGAMRAKKNVNQDYPWKAKQASSVLPYDNAEFSSITAADPQIELVNQYRRKKKEETKHFIQNGGSLTVAEVKERRKSKESWKEMLNLDLAGHQHAVIVVLLVITLMSQKVALSN